MSMRGKSIDQLMQEEQERGKGNSYKDAQDMHPGDVFNPKTNQKSEKIESKWIDRDQIFIYSTIGVVIIAIVLLFVFL